MRRSLRAWLAGGAATILVVGTVAQVGAFDTGGYVEVAATVAVGQNSEGGGSVSCPAGHRVVAGGAYWTVDGIPGFDTKTAKDRWLSASQPLGASGWWAAGRNFGAASTLHVTAFCLPTATVGPVTVRSGFAPDDDPAARTQSCPDGMRVITGGASWRWPGTSLRDPANHDAGGLQTLWPTATGRGFQATGNRATTGTAPRLFVVAHCVPDAAAGAPSIRTATLDLAASKAFQLRVGCPTGERVITGGARMWYASSFYRSRVVHAASVPTVNDWYVSGRASASQPYRITLRVLCRPT
jgi:hypothetical protein